MALPLVSDFTGANENPLSEGGNWAVLDTAVATRSLQRISNAVTAQANADCFVYWTPANFGADLEAYVTLSTVSTNQGIVCRIQGEGGSSTWDGYYVYSLSGGIRVSVVTNAAATIILTIASGTFGAGDKLGVRIRGSTIQAWQQHVSVSSDWILRGSIVDATYASAGKIGLYAGDTTGRMDDFYAGGIEWAFGDVPVTAPIFGR